jgi:hypothetical protein
MLVYWEDGALGSVLQALPKQLTTFEGTLVVYGKASAAACEPNVKDAHMLRYL